MNHWYKNLKENFPEQYSRMQKFGRRNVSFSTVAPTGTVSLMTQTSSGIEPQFQPFYTRRKKVNPGEEGVRIDFTDQNGDTWQEFPVLEPKFKEWIVEHASGGTITYEDLDSASTSEINKETIQQYFEKSPWYGSTANDIDWVKRVEIQSIIQKYITHSISSTINLPEDVSLEAVSEIYMESWKKGLKGITVYRDGSRSGVLVSEPKSREEFEYVDATKRPKEVTCKVHTTTTASNKYNVFIGLLNDKPYEVFVTDHFTNEEELVLKKIKKGRYDLIKDGEVYSEDITTEMSDEQEAITRLVSTSLRHGADIKFIVEQLSKTSGDMFGFTKGLARVLKKYIPDGAKSTINCLDCGSDNVVFEEGCMSCKSCGSSKCG